MVIAGGGTGGHLFPALAAADEFKKKVRDMEIIFIGTSRGLEAGIIPGRGYELKTLDVEGLKRRKGVAWIRALYKAVVSTFRAVSLLRKIRPDGVIGCGSYSSGPVVLAARFLGIKTAILEQNVRAGLTNRLLGRIVDRIYISWDESRRFFPLSRTVLSGNPVREEILKQASAAPKKGKTTILVFGGSQGATAINAAFLDSLEYLTDMMGSFNIIHQTGKEGFDMVFDAYKRKKIKADIYPFIADMAGAYGDSDIVIARSGATTIAELAALGIAAILIPYPFASDGHQELNAKLLQDKGAAVMINQDDLTGKTLADAIRKLIGNHLALNAMRERMKELGRPDAARTIVEDYIGFLKGGV